MKKIIAFLLAVLMVFSLTACMSLNDYMDDKDNEKTHDFGISEENEDEDDDNNQKHVSYDDDEKKSEENDDYVCYKIAYQNSDGKNCYYLIDYDNNGNISSCNHYYYLVSSQYVNTSSGSFLTAFHNYDDTGCFFCETSDGEFKNVSTTKENGCVVERRTSSDEKVDIEWEVRYNKDGLPVSETIVDIYFNKPWGTYEPAFQYLYEYDSYGRLSGQTVSYYNRRTIYSSGSTEGRNWSDRNDSWEVANTNYTYYYQTLSENLETQANRSESGGNENGGGSSGGNTSNSNGKICAVCQGKGYYTCIGCDNGKVLSYYDINDKPVYRTCSVCGGLGTIRCKTCGGDGRVQDD